MEVWTPARWITARIHRNEHTPGKENIYYPKTRHDIENIPSEPHKKYCKVKTWKPINLFKSVYWLYFAKSLENIAWLCLQMSHI